MPDLTFQEVNNKIGKSIFSFTVGDNTISLNVSDLTGDTYAGLTDTGVVEFCFKLLKICQETQVEKNLTATPKLSSFGNLFYGTVQAGNPPTIQGSASVSAIIPLDINSLSGSNS